MAEQFQPGAIVDPRVQRLRHNPVVAVVAIEIVQGIPVDPRISDERDIDPGRTGEQFGRRATFEEAVEQLVEASRARAEATVVLLGVDLALRLTAHKQEDGSLAKLTSWQLVERFGFKDDLRVITSTRS